MHKVLVIPGDGIGPEITEATLRVLEAVQTKYGVNIEFTKALAGDEAYRKLGKPLPDETLKLIAKSDAILKGPVGETAYDVIVKLRMMLNLYANIRPAKSFKGIPAVKEADLVIVRENVEGVYVGAEYRVGGVAFALKVITSDESKRIAEVAAKVARKRKNKVTIVHKANVLRITDGLFRDETRKILENYGVEVDEMYVDAAAMELVRNPKRFDVILTMNQYGDILSDLAAQVVGGLGLAPSANIGFSKALFEPVHGAAWDIAGKGIANPTAMILSAAMMLEWFGYVDVAKKIWSAVENVFLSGIKTPDIGGTYSTMEFAKAVASRV